MKLLIINGSPRKFGRTRIVTNYISDKLNMKKIDLSEGDIPLFNGTNEQNDLEGVFALRKLVKEADGIIVASPEYHNGMSGVLKNALDFLGSEHFTNKPVGLLVVAGGGKGGINALNNMRIVLRGVYGNVLPKQLILDPNNFDSESSTLTVETIPLVDDLLKDLTLYVKASLYILQTQGTKL